MVRGVDPSMIVFLDFEASSLHVGSHPIEVGWVNGDGRGESFLLRPLRDWTDWSPASEAVHGISRTQLDAEGHDPATVAHRLHAALQAADAYYSDNPGHDGAWLCKLFAAADLPRPGPPQEVYNLWATTCRPLLRWLPQRREGDVDRVYDAAAATVRLRARQLIAISEEAESQQYRVRHRALPDAEGLRWTWLDLNRRVGEAVE